jgi:hypothetical protein
MFGKFIASSSILLKAILPFLTIELTRKMKKSEKSSFFSVFPAQQTSWTGLIEVGTLGESNLFDIAEVFFLAKNLLS